MSRCSRGRTHGPADIGNLCRACATKLHPGKVWFLGRWRTREEAIERVKGDRAMRGVSWALEGGFVVGRLGGFEIRLVAPEVQNLDACDEILHSTSVQIPDTDEIRGTQIPDTQKVVECAGADRSGIGQIPEDHTE